jgi:3-oxoacyl-(acyl-carrier-protein) synthase
MIRLIAVAAFTLAIATSAHAMTLAPLHQSDGMITQVRHACGAGMHMVNGHCVTTVARRQARRCLVWGAGHVCRKWG